MAVGNDMIIHDDRERKTAGIGAVIGPGIGAGIGAGIGVGIGGGAIETYSEHSIVGRYNAAFEDGDEKDIRVSVIPKPVQIKSKNIRSGTVQDGGYAWVVLFCSFMIGILSTVAYAAMGVILLELGKSFDASEVELNAAATLQFGIAMTLGPFTSQILVKLGARSSVVLGSLITTAAFIATSFVPNALYFLLTFGILCGFGVSLLVLSAVMPLYDYFDRRRSLAFGIFSSAFSISIFIWPPLLTQLFEYYGWRGSMLILAGFQLNICVLGALMRPNKTQSTRNNNQENGMSRNIAALSSSELQNSATNTQTTLENNNTPVDFTTPPQAAQQQHQHQHQHQQTTTSEANKQQHTPQSQPRGSVLQAGRDTKGTSLKSQLKIFRNSSFMIYSSICLLAYTGYAFGTAYIPTMADKQGASGTEAALLVSVFGITNCISRGFHGIIGDMGWIRRNQLCVSIYSYFFTGICKICVIRATTYTHLAIFAAFEGYAIAPFNVMGYSIFGEIVAPEHRELALGIGTFCGGISMIAGNASSGWMYSYFGTLDVPAVVLDINPGWRDCSIPIHPDQT